MRKNYLNLAKSQERKNIKNNKEIFGREIDSIAEALNLEEELLTGYYVWYKLEGQLCKKFIPCLYLSYLRILTTYILRIDLPIWDNMLPLE